MIKKLINIVLVGSLLLQVSLYGDNIELPIINGQDQVDGASTLNITIHSKALSHHIARGSVKTEGKEITQVSGFHLIPCGWKTEHNFKGVDGFLYDILKIPSGLIVGTAGKPPLFVVVPHKWEQLENSFVGYILLLDSNVFKDFFRCSMPINMLPQMLRDGEVVNISRYDDGTMNIQVRSLDEVVLFELRGRYTSAVNTLSLKTMFPYDVNTIPHEVLNQARGIVGLKPLVWVEGASRHSGSESVPSSPMKKATMSFSESVLKSVQENNVNFLENQIKSQINFEEMVEGAPLGKHIMALLEKGAVSPAIQKLLQEPMLTSAKMNTLRRKGSEGILDKEEINNFKVPSSVSIIIDGTTPFVYALKQQNFPLAEQLLMLGLDNAGTADDGQVPINLIIKEFLETGSKMSQSLLELVMKNILVLPQTQRELTQYITEQIERISRLGRKSKHVVKAREQAVLELLNNRAATVESMRKGYIPHLHQAITLRLKHDLDLLMRNATHEDLLNGLQYALAEDDILSAKILVIKILALKPPLNSDDQKTMRDVLNQRIESLIQKEDVQNLLNLLGPFGDGFYTAVYIKALELGNKSITRALVESRPMVDGSNKPLPLSSRALNIVDGLLKKAVPGSPRRNTLLRTRVLLQDPSQKVPMNKEN